MSDETEAEVEAAIAVYGADCTVLRRLPPHLVVRLKPRTADDISLQFVEAALVMKASSEYPQKPPLLEIKDTKGLDAERESCLLSELQVLSNELNSNPMLVALCEAALDKLTDMNQPDGNCCFCMFPLVMENESSGAQPFMKLISCFHCFHSNCFRRWFQWILLERGISFETHNPIFYEGESDITDMYGRQKEMLEELQLKCPVCRKPVSDEDMTSIRNSIAAAESSSEQTEELEVALDHEVISNASEAERKTRFNNIFETQQQHGGIIEPKKLEVLVPGMFVSLPMSKVPTNSSVLSTDAGSTSASQGTETPEFARVEAKLKGLVLSSQDQADISEASGCLRFPKDSGSQRPPKSRRKEQQRNHDVQKSHWVKCSRENPQRDR